MKKLWIQWIIPAILVGAAYRYRYMLLNELLSNQWLRKISVNTAMNIPAVKNRLISSTFRK